MSGKPTKWGINAHGLVDRSNGYLLMTDIPRKSSTVGRTSGVAKDIRLSKIISFLL
jgi:hypothetical protein